MHGSFSVLAYIMSSMTAHPR